MEIYYYIEKRAKFMTVYRVTYINEPPISELEFIGKIIYESPVMKMLWLRTDANIEALKRIGNVSLVEIDIKPERTRTYLQ